jgi:hypothetical protein
LFPVRSSLSVYAFSSRLIGIEQTIRRDPRSLKKFTTVEFGVQNEKETKTSFCKHKIFRPESHFDQD